MKIETTPEHVEYKTLPPIPEEQIDADGPPYSRNTVWMTQRGEYVRVRHLKDTHLVNIIAYVQDPRNSFHSRWPGAEKEQFLNVLKDEVTLRGLSKEFVDKAYLPYQHKNTWYLTVNAPVLCQTAGLRVIRFTVGSE